MGFSLNIDSVFQDRRIIVTSSTRGTIYILSLIQNSKDSKPLGSSKKKTKFRPKNITQIKQSSEKSNNHQKKQQKKWKEKRRQSSKTPSSCFFLSFSFVFIFQHHLYKNKKIVKKTWHRDPELSSMNANRKLKPNINL